MKYAEMDLLPAGAVLTATGFGAQKPIASITMAAVAIAVTSGAGTATPTMTAWIQVSPDNGATWIDMPHDWRLVGSAAAADVTATAGKRNIVDVLTTLTATQHLAIYKHVPAALARLAYVISGTNPVWTIAMARLVGK